MGGKGGWKGRRGCIGSNARWVIAGRGVAEEKF